MPYKHRKNFIANDENIRDFIFKGYVIIFEIYVSGIQCPKLMWLSKHRKGDELMLEYKSKELDFKTN